MKQILIYMIWIMVTLPSCTTTKLPIFSNQIWHVDPISGHAISSSGMELGFGSEWLIRDTTLIQSSTQMQKYARLEDFLVKVISRFPEISADSIYFYNPARGLLFASYHQEKALKPTAEIRLYNDTSSYFGKDYSRIFGDMTTYIEESGWEMGPGGLVYTNLYYSPKDKELVILQRIPYKGDNLAVYHIRATIPRKGKWWRDYPRGTFWKIDLGDTNNLEAISTFLHSSRTTAVSNLNLTLPKD